MHPWRFSWRRWIGVFGHRKKDPVSIFQGFSAAKQHDTPDGHSVLTFGLILLETLKPAF
jgi:hypothetical protein